MKSSYNPKEIEKKWQKIWEEKKAFAATDFPGFLDVLTYLSYPVSMNHFDKIYSASFTINR